MKVLGLDISTSTTGICILETKEKEVEPDLILLDKIEFKNCKTFWEKVDLAREYISSKSFEKKSLNLDEIFIEESLQSFRTGMSSAATITTLAKFNSLLSYFVREKFNKDPHFLAAVSARKLCGIQILKNGKSAKEQTFDWAAAGPLKDYPWPLKKNGFPKDWSKDATDAYVIARAGIVKLFK